MSLLIHRAHSAARTLPAVRNYAVSRPNPRPRDPVLTSPNAKVQQIAPDVTFIRNPPSSVPTPHSLTIAPASPLLSKHIPDASPSFLPPPLRQEKPDKGPKLNQAQIEEIKQLRYKDPKTNSCQVLARQYGCSPIFVSMVAPLGEVQRRELEKEQNTLQEQWGERKQLIRAIRRKRREFW